MNYIPMSVLEYRFNDDGITQKIIVAFQSYQGNEQFNARISLSQEFVQSINDKLELERMNKSQIERFARIKLRDWVLTTKPETEAEETEKEVE